MEKETQLVTASFHKTIKANTNLTLKSNKIDLPFRTKRIRAAFAPGCNRLMRLYFFISPDPSTPTTDEPTGTNLLAYLGPQFYIVGEDCIVDFQHETDIQTAGYYLKVYAENLDIEDHTIDVQITVEIIPWENVEESKPTTIGKEEKT